MCLARRRLRRGTRRRSRRNCWRRSCVRTQLPLHLAPPLAHWHVPPWQVVPAPHTVSQPPQLELSVCSSTQEPPHAERPPPQVHWPATQGTEPHEVAARAAVVRVARLVDARAPADREVRCALQLAGARDARGSLRAGHAARAAVGRVRGGIDARARAKGGLHCRSCTRRRLEHTAGRPRTGRRRRRSSARRCRRRCMPRCTP
jgi:hypothetical protein